MGIEVLLKLLPFTHSEHGELTFIAGMDLADWLITIVICFLIFLSIKWGMELKKSYNLDKEKIFFLNDLITQHKDNFSEKYNIFLDKLTEFDAKNNNRELTHLWNEFDESLIRSQKGMFRKEELYNSIDADYFFNKHKLLTHIGSKKYSTVPSLLLGIGLIGTFLGLFVGLVNLNLDGNDTKAMQDSMQLLIHAAGVKFASSIWGLSLSLGFTYYDKTREKLLEDKIEEIQNIIDSVFKRLTAEQSLVEISNNGEEQREALNDLRSTLHTTIIDSQQESDNKITERLDMLVDVLENFTVKTGTNNADALKNAVESFLEGLKDAGENQGNALAEVLKDSTIKLENLVNVIEKTAQLQEERNDKLRQDIEEIKNSQQEMLSKLGETLSIGINQATKSLEEAGTSLASSQHEVLDRLDTTLSLLASSPKELERVFEEIKISANAINNSIINMSSTLKDTPRHLELLGDSADKINISGDKIQIAGNNFAKFNDSIEQYRQSIQNASNMISQANQNAQLTNTESQKTYERISKQYQELLDNNKKSIDEFSKSVKNYLDDYHRNTQKGITDTFGAFDSKLSQFANAMSESVSQLSDAVEQLSEKVRR